MKTITLPTLRDMLEAGVHFGHKKQYSDARGRDNFYGVRDKVVIINLEKTREALERALTYIAQESQKGAIFLFVGTKPQVREKIKKIASELNMPYVTNRWLGGTLTNFKTIESNLKKLNEMEEALEKGDSTRIRTKKEKTVLMRTIEKSKRNLAGMVGLKQLPTALIIIDPVEEKPALTESKSAGIPSIAIMDTNANPKGIDYPIPANDDAPKSLDLILGLIQKTIKDNFKPLKTEEPKEAKKTNSATKQEPKEPKKIVTKAKEKK